MSPRNASDDDRLVEEIYDALDADEPDRALASARIALHDAPSDPVLHFLAGIALLDMGRPEDASGFLARAAELDPDDGEFRAAHAQALFASCDFAEAEGEARAALEADPRAAEATRVLAMLHERRGEFEAAEARYREAARLDPDRFPPPARTSRAEFEEAVVRAGTMLPEEFRRRLDEVPVMVEDVPSDALLSEEAPRLDPELLGLFVGTALPERSYGSGGVESPPRILLFRRNLERFARDRDELEREIARTLHHELAHYLGFEEDAMEDLDLD